uniref:Uncharacterized protein n=1 Tax=Romanomermis culicivorax TaxID=13658 RepID=A0A915JMJ9_ROMCU
MKSEHNFKIKAIILIQASTKHEKNKFIRLADGSTSDCYHFRNALKIGDTVAIETLTLIRKTLKDAENGMKPIGATFEGWNKGWKTSRDRRLNFKLKNENL